MDKALLFKPRLTEGTVTIPGVGEVRVRALSRLEVVEEVQKAQGQVEMERKILTLGMVDPALTADEVTEWQRVSAASEIEPVVEKISELSGLLDDAAKEAMRSFRGEPGPDV